MFVISVHLVLVPDSQWVVLLQPFSMQVLLHRYHDPSLSPSSTNIILRWNEKKNSCLFATLLFWQAVKGLL